MGGKGVRQEDWLEENKDLVKMGVPGIIETGCLQNRCLQVPRKCHAVSRVHLIDLEDYGLIFSKSLACVELQIPHLEI